MPGADDGRRRLAAWRGVAMAIVAVLVTLTGLHVDARPAAALTCVDDPTCLGPGDAAWDAYYAAPTDSSRWSAFCGGGGGGVVVTALGVPACGPTGTTNIVLPSGSSAITAYSPGFQCVELVVRYLYVTRGWPVVSVNGAGIARGYALAHGLPTVANGTSGQAPHVGDVVSFSNASDFSDVGHTAVVTQSAVDGAGNGSIKVLNENVNGTGSINTLTVSSWTVVGYGYSHTEWMTPGPPLSAPERFVTAAYHDFLSRAPSASELSSDASASTTADGRAALIDRLAKSPEWVGALVDRYYQSTLGRPGDPNGKAFWVRSLQSGAMTPATVAAAFYASDEYFQNIGGGTVASWVDDLYHKLLLRNPDPDGAAYWRSVAASSGRLAVASAFYKSPESCGVRVAVLYQSLLGRAPDPGGQSYWAGIIAQDGNDIALAVRLATSTEYYDRAQNRYA